MNHRPDNRAVFGRRKGRPLRTHQSALFETLLPRLALDLTAPAPPDLRALLAPDCTSVNMEIGFGGGEHLIAQAKLHPDVGFIGVEPFLNGIAKILAAIDVQDLRNIRLHHGDAADVLAWLPDTSLTRVDLLYPDPWPKKRHWKRRFVQSDRLRELARIIAPGGAFRFASDIDDYVAWTLARALRDPDFIWDAERADDWRLPWADYTRTRYEAKAKREGRKSCYLVFRRR